MKQDLGFIWTMLGCHLRTDGSQFCLCGLANSYGHLHMIWDQVRAAGDEDLGVEVVPLNCIHHHVVSIIDFQELAEGEPWSTGKDTAIL